MAHTFEPMGAPHLCCVDLFTSHFKMRPHESQDSYPIDAGSSLALEQCGGSSRSPFLASDVKTHAP
jgi:hypothetical protein